MGALVRVDQRSWLGRTRQGVELGRVGSRAVGGQGLSLIVDIWVTESRWCLWPHSITGQSRVYQRARVVALPGVPLRDGGEDTLDESEVSRRQHDIMLDSCCQGVTYACYWEVSQTLCHWQSTIPPQQSPVSLCEAVAVPCWDPPSLWLTYYHHGHGHHEGQGGRGSGLTVQGASGHSQHF